MVYFKHKKGWIFEEEKTYTFPEVSYLNGKKSSPKKWARCYIFPGVSRLGSVFRLVRVFQSGSISQLKVSTLEIISQFESISHPWSVFLFSSLSSLSLSLGYFSPTRDCPGFYNFAWDFTSQTKKDFKWRWFLSLFCEQKWKVLRIAWDGENIDRKIFL